VRQDLIGEIILEFRTESLSCHSCKLYVIDIWRKGEREIRHLFSSICGVCCCGYDRRILYQVMRAILS